MSSPSSSDIWLPRALQASGYLFDSMDTVRDSKTDRLFPYAPAALHRLYQWARAQQKRTGVVTNGPWVELADFIAACAYAAHQAPTYQEDVHEAVKTPYGDLDSWLTAPALPGNNELLFGVAEGGGVYGDVQDGRYRKVILVPQDQLAAMREMKAKEREDAFVGQLVRYYDTPYDTARVLTLPRSLSEFRAHMGDITPRSLDRDLTEDNWIGRMLLYLGNYYADLAQKLGDRNFAPYVTKPQNRRGYQYCGMTCDGRPLNKKSGTEAASVIAGEQLMGNHVYTSDRVESAPEKVMCEGAALSVDVVLNGDLLEYDENKNILRVNRFDRFTEALVAA